MKLSDYFTSVRPLLVAVAAYPEVLAVIEGLTANVGPGKQFKLDVARDRWFAYDFGPLTVLQTGVGKANAAGAVCTELMRAKLAGRPYDAVVSIGISGSYDASLPMETMVFANRCVLADEGLALDESVFQSLEQRGWAQTIFPVKPAAFHEGLVGDREGTIATISAISGTADLARQYAERSGGTAEDMETAALALICSKHAIPFGALRVICNICGDPTSWKTDLGFQKISEVVEDWGFKVTECRQYSPI